MRVWVLGGALTGAAFTNADEESSAAAIATLGHTVTRVQSTTVSAVPTRADCDVVVHLSGTTSLSTALRCTAAGATPVITMNADYVQNVNGGLAFTSGSPFTTSNTSIVITNATAIDFTDGHVFNDTVAISGSALTLRRVASGFVAGAQIWCRGAGGVFDYVGYNVGAGTTNLAAVTTTARMGAFLYDDQIGSFNAAGLQLLDDLMAWVSVPVTVTTWSPQVLVEGDSVTITGTGFDATQGSGSVVADVGVKSATQTVTSWSDTSITFTVVTDDTSNEPIAAFPELATITVTNRFGSTATFDAPIIDAEETDYHGETVVGVHLAFGEGPRDFSDLPDDVIWTDVTDRVRGFSFKRGRQHELARVQAGTATVMLSNGDGAFNQHNTSSPFYPNVRPLVPIRITTLVIPDGDITDTGWQFDRQWSGYVESWPVSFPNRADAVANVTCSDLFKALALASYSEATWESTLLADSPVALWRMSGDPAEADATGNGHTLTWLGAPQEEQAGAWESDVSIGLDGNDDHATSADHIDFEVFDDMSVELWIYPTTAADATASIVGVHTNTSTFDPIWDISYRADDEQVLFFPVLENSGMVLADNVTLNTWHHIAVTIEWTPGPNRTITGYHNGVEVSKIQTGYTPAAATRELLIGTWFISGLTSFFGGRISEIAFFDRLLSSAEISEHYSASRDLLPEETTDTRVGRILDLYVDGDADLTVRDAGQTTMAARAPSGQTLSEIQTTMETENGLFFAGGDGVPVFEGRHYRLDDEIASRGTFGPANDELTYQGIVLSYDDAELANLARVSSGDAGVVASVVDAVSLNTYGPRVIERTIYPSDDNEALAAAAFLVTTRGNPETRVRSIQFDLGGDTAVWKAVLGGDLSQRWTVEKALTGDDFAQDVFIEAIHMSVSSSKQWQVTWELSAAVPQTFWLLGTAGFSELGTTTRPAY